MKKYAVDVHLDFARCYEVEAESCEAAELKVKAKVCVNGFNPLKEGFEQTEYYEVSCSGETDENGVMEYF